MDPCLLLSKNGVGKAICISECTFAAVLTKSHAFEVIRDMFALRNRRVFLVPASRARVIGNVFEETALIKRLFVS